MRFFNLYFNFGNKISIRNENVYCYYKMLRVSEMFVFTISYFVYLRLFLLCTFLFLIKIQGINKFFNVSIIPR